MGRKQQVDKQEVTPAPVSNLDLYGDNLRRHMDRVSSCPDCLKERSRESDTRNKKHKKAARTRLNSPIVVRLQDAIKANGKLRPKSLNKQDSLEHSSDESSSSKKETVSLNNALPAKPSLQIAKGEKNFSAFLSAVEKVHSKEKPGLSTSFENLAAFIDESKEKNSTNCLNNSVNYQHSISEKSTKRSLGAIEGDNIELICNDLSGKSSVVDSEDSCEDSEPSENSSVVSSSEESPSDSDASSTADSLSEDFTKEELERLTEYTTGFPLTKYECLPHECPECLAAYYAYTQFCYQGDFWNSPAELDDHGRDWDSDSSESSVEEWHPDSEVLIKGEGKVEVSVAWLHKDRNHRRRHKRGHSLVANSVSVNLTDSDVQFSVQYLPAGHHSHHHHNSRPYYEDWSSYYPGMAYGFLPYALPYYMVPPYYCLFPFFTIPKPLCVPRNLRCLNSQRLCMVPAHEVKNCKLLV